MKFGVVTFPGSNCDEDAALAVSDYLGATPVRLWHKDHDLQDVDVVILPGGFAHGDALRAGAIARFSPIMQAVVEEARAGKLVIGICNGFQILCEAGLLPGALVRNRSLHFACEMVTTRIEIADSPFTHGCRRGDLLRLPIAHGEGCFYADERTLLDLNEHDQIMLRYVDSQGRVIPEANPNGSMENIAGIRNLEGNVFGLMPHPDRACDARLGSADGLKIFRSMLHSVETIRSRAA